MYRRIAATLAAAGLVLGLTAAAPPDPESATFGPDHIVQCWVKPGVPWIASPEGVRTLFGPGTLKCAPTPPDESRAYVQVQMFVPGKAWQNVGPAVWNFNETVYDFWQAPVFCPYPYGNTHLFRTKMYGWLSEDGITDDGYGYSKSMTASCWYG